MNAYVMFAGGGTAGHLFPAFTVAAELEQKYGARIVFVGSKLGMEQQLVPERGYPLVTIAAAKLKHLPLMKQIRAFFVLPLSFLQALAHLLRYRPKVVVGIGGYASFAPVLMGFLTGRKTIVLEQNAVPGLTNKLLAHIAHRVFVSFQSAAEYFQAPEKTLFSGNPIRAEFKADVARGKAEKACGEVDVNKVFNLCVFGGSQGSAFLNSKLLEAFALLSIEEKGRIAVVHQTGKAQEVEVKQAYAKLGIVADVRPFFADLGYLMAKSDLVIARSGSSVFEIAYSGIPALLVPFAASADNHQLKNARIMEAAGGAVVVEEKDCTKEALLAAILAIRGNYTEYVAKATTGDTFGRRDAEVFIAREAVALLGGRQ